MTSEDIWAHDECERFRTWGAEYALPAVPLAQALAQSLRAGLIAGRGSEAQETLLGIAAQPGLDIQAYNLYDIAQHHAALLEIVTAYLASDGPWIPAGSIDQFQPDSFLLPDGRLRRVILCSNFNELRKQEEIHSWRTMADVCVTGRPMLLNFIVIGQSRKGFRSSPWTQGYVHPENGVLRVQRIASEKTGPNPRFSDNWKKVYREQTDHKPKEWLAIMQKDQAFDGLVYSWTVDVPLNQKVIFSDIKRVMREIESGGTSMRRSACFRYAPCPMAEICHAPGNLTPEMCGWERKGTVLSCA